MDKQILKTKLKKYLFFVSIVFLSITSIHLIYNFVYFDSKEVPQKWGTISESFVGVFPNLNPLKYNNDYNSYINNILYRSLLTYDINEKKIVWDLVTCDIENTKKIECNLSWNIKWSSWENITTEDIVFTYETIKNHNTNPLLKSLLDNVEITKGETSILFESNISDVNILNIFFQPIMPKVAIDKIDQEKLKSNFSPIDWIYSWKYKIAKVDQDETVWFKKIFLEKNSYYTKNPIYIDNITLKIYKDHPSLLQQKDSINIFNDKKNLIWDSIVKLQNHKYILPQYVWVFINKDKLEYPNLRNYILSQINSQKILESVWENNNKLIESPFLNEIKLDIKKNTSSLKTMLNSLGFYKKSYHLSKVWINTVEKNIKKISGEVQIEEKINTWSLLKSDKVEVNITEIKNSITKENYNSSSKIIKSPEWVDKYNFITNSEITLEWISSKNVSEVYVNDYKLKNNKPNTEKFFYKLSTSINNIKAWENNYKIYFVENGKKSLKEEITFFYNKDKNNLAKNEIDLITNLINSKVKKAKEIAIEKQVEAEKEEQNKIKKQVKEQETNTLNSEQIKKQNLINALDSKFYYDNNFNPYELNLSYINWSKEIAMAAEETQNQLEDVWIKIELSPLTLTVLQEQIKENKEEYNILLTWINLWYFNFNISKYFYSWQIDSWKNVSKIKNSDLDNILEDLKSWIFDNNKTIELEKQIINILQNENVFKPLYSPYYSNLVLKNIEWYELNEIIPNDSYRFNPLVKSYILKEKIINNDWKNIFWFIEYIINNLF